MNVPTKPIKHWQWLAKTAKIAKIANAASFPATARFIAVAGCLGALAGNPTGAGASDGQQLKVTFNHGSGVNPRHFERWQCSLDTHSMKAEEASRLIKLVNSTEVLSSKESEYKTTEGGPFYSIEIDSGNQKRVFPGHIRTHRQKSSHW